MKIKSSAYKENLIYLTLWLILFIAPASSMYMRVQNNSAMSMDWSEIFHVWNLYTAYLIIFLIHNFILAPLLIYKKKKVIYLATTICLITIFVIFQFSQKPKDFRKKMEKHRIEFMARDLRMHGFKVDKLPHQFDRADHGPMGMNDRPDMKERHPDLPMFLAEKDIISSMILVLLIGMNLGVKLYFKNDKEKAKFAGVKKGDKVMFNPSKSCDASVAELASMLNIDKEKAANVTSNFEMTVTDITHLQPAELNQELFDNVFGKDVVKTEEEYFAKLREMIAHQLVPESDYKFSIDARAAIEKAVGEFDLPDAFLKRWVLATNENLTVETLEADYSKMIADLKWQLIKDKIAKANDTKIETSDIEEYAKKITKAQFAQYGMISVPEDVLENYAKDMLKNKETLRNVVDRAVEEKLSSWLKEQVTLDVKEVSAEEFGKIVE